MHLAEAETETQAAQSGAHTAGSRSSRSLASNVSALGFALAAARLAAPALPTSAGSDDDAARNLLLDEATVQWSSST